MNSVEENSEDDLWDEISDDENEGDEMEDDEEDMNPGINSWPIWKSISS